MDAPRTLLFLHAPHAVGPSLTGQIANRFPARDCLLGPSRSEGPLGYAFVAGEVSFDDLAHFPRRPLLLTVLREPIDRALAAFAALGRREGLVQFIDREPDLAEEALGNAQARTLAGEALWCQRRQLAEGELLDCAIHNLGLCDVVGTYDRPDLLGPPLCEVMGWSPLGPLGETAPPCRDDLDATTLERLEALTSLDALLYRFAVERCARLARREEAPARDAPLFALPSGARAGLDEAIHGVGWGPRAEDDHGTFARMAERTAWLDLRCPKGPVRAFRVEVAGPAGEARAAGALLASVAVRINGQPVVLSARPCPGGAILEGPVPVGALQTGGRVRACFTLAGGAGGFAVRAVQLLSGAGPSGARRPRIHLGHHGAGAGNLGDDWVLAGFLAAARSGAVAHITSFAHGNRTLLGQRFPEVDWREDRASREEAVRACDVWVALGVAGSPDQLDEELAWCRRFGKPVYVLGAGWEGRDEHPTDRALLAHARSVWARDERSVGCLAKLAGGHVSLGADPAHLVLREWADRNAQPGALGLLLHSAGERPCSRALYRLLESGRWSPHWLVQEVRSLPGSERDHYDDLPAPRRAGLPACVPAYCSSTARQLARAWPVPEVLLSSHPHALLWGAWHGCRLVGVGDEARGTSEGLGVAHLPAFRDGDAVLAALERSTSVRRARLEGLAGRAEAMCRAFFAEVTGAVAARRRAA